MDYLPLTPKKSTMTTVRLGSTLDMWRLASAALSSAVHVERSGKEIAMPIRFEGTHLSSTTPPYAMPPFTYENNQMLYITFKTSPDVLRALVPEPLVVNPDSLMTIYVGMLNVVDPGPISYYEAAILIPVSYGNSKGSYMPILYLDKALPITIGREVWGFPKFQADLCFGVEAGVVHATVAKEGTTLIDATLHMGEPVPPTPSPPASVFLLKSIPSAEGGSTYDVKQLTAAVIRGGMDSEVRPGAATLRLGSTASDPLGMISVLEVVSGVYRVGGSVLDYGEVVHDYLAEEQTTTGLSRKHGRR
jgi:acetoacetate decarboxylase